MCGHTVLLCAPFVLLRVGNRPPVGLRGADAREQWRPLQTLSCIARVRMVYATHVSSVHMGDAGSHACLALCEISEIDMIRRRLADAQNKCLLVESCMWGRFFPFTMRRFALQQNSSSLLCHLAQVALGRCRHPAWSPWCWRARRRAGAFSPRSQRRPRRKSSCTCHQWLRFPAVCEALMIHGRGALQKLSLLCTEPCGGIVGRTSWSPRPAPRCSATGARPG